MDYLLLSVLGSDVIYNEEAVVDLLDTLMQLCGTQTTIILAGELRNGRLQPPSLPSSLCMHSSDWSNVCFCFRYHPWILLGSCYEGFHYWASGSCWIPPRLSKPPGCDVCPREEVKPADGKYLNASTWKLSLKILLKEEIASGPRDRSQMILFVV